MSDLKDQKCVPCEVGGQPLDEVSTKKLLMEISDWIVVEENDMKEIKREFKFFNFKEALVFVDRVGAIAEEEQHHPKIVLEWGKVVVYWWTHKIKGLHPNDFIMAARTDDVYSQLKS